VLGRSPEIQQASKKTAEFLGTGAGEAPVLIDDLALQLVSVVGIAGALPSYAMIPAE
jgi:hypothetical protein